MTIDKNMAYGKINLDVNNIQVIESILNTSIILDNIKETTLDEVMTIRWKSDMYGLLHNELGIPNSACYINMRINGYRDPLEYDGRSTIKIIDPDIVVKILKYI